jgi:hypothetical protein
MQSRLLPVVLLGLAVPALAVKPKPAPAAPAVPAVPAAPAKSQEAPAKPAAIISSDVGGRDLVFIANALEVSKTLTFLAGQAGHTSNATLKGYGDDLVKTLAAHGAVLNTVAEMRNVKPPTESPSEKRLVEKLAKLEGAKLEKSILDAFIEMDERMVATYELGAKSEDVTIAKFVEQALPQARQHLELMQGMAGIAPKRRPAPKAPPIEVATNPKPEAPKPAPPKAEPPKPKPEATTKPDPIAEPPAEDPAPKKLEGEKTKPATRPAFRTNVKPPAE